jgi:regulatory protein
VTQRSIGNAATAYLRRYFTTRVHLERVLIRKANRWNVHHGGSQEEARALITAHLDRLVAAGILDDARYLADKARSLSRRGTSRRQIAVKLRFKGATSQEIDAALAEVAEEADGDPERIAAARYVRRRRLGPYSDSRPTAVSSQRGPDARQKDLAKLGRAGFSYDIARWALDADRDELDELQGRA